jgi:modification methylase
MALMGSRSDRFILEPVAASYGAPTASKKLHPSEKPEPMLKHFFRMFVNEDTVLLDPTCGGGSALRAADEMGAARVIGLELDPEYAAAANGALRIARNKRVASAKVA